MPYFTGLLHNSLLRTIAVFTSWQQQDGSPHHCMLLQSLLGGKRWRRSHAHGGQHSLPRQRACVLAPTCAPTPAGPASCMCAQHTQEQVKQTASVLAAGRFRPQLAAPTEKQIRFCRSIGVGLFVYLHLPAVVPGTQSELYSRLVCQGRALHTSQRRVYMPLLSFDLFHFFGPQHEWLPSTV